MIRDWNNHYKKGNSSGTGSIGRYRKWKWSIIDKYVGEINSVVDIGCGDLSFFGDRFCDNYTGIDISTYIINENRIKRPSGLFIDSDVTVYFELLKAETVFCFDMLFHVLDDNDYDKILLNLCLYSQKWIFIFTWQRNPFYSWKSRKSYFFNKKWKELFKSLIHRFVTDNYFQKYRNLMIKIGLFQSFGFELKVVKTPEFDKISAMYIFKKKR